MLKARVNITFTLEYVITDINYPEGTTDEEKLQIDLEAIREDPYNFINGLDATVSGELIQT